MLQVVPASLLQAAIVSIWPTIHPFVVLDHQATKNIICLAIYKDINKAHSYFAINLSTKPYIFGITQKRAVMFPAPYVSQAMPLIRQHHGKALGVACLSKIV